MKMAPLQKDDPLLEIPGGAPDTSNVFRQAAKGSCTFAFVTENIKKA
jgi:hypothetical protein